jgi:hypothetical protein
MVNTKSLTTISIAAVTTTMMGNPYILLVKAEKFSKVLESEYSDSNRDRIESEVYDEFLSTG